MENSMQSAVLRGIFLCRAGGTRLRYENTPTQGIVWASLGGII